MKDYQLEANIEVKYCCEVSCEYLQGRWKILVLSELSELSCGETGVAPGSLDYVPLCTGVSEQHVSVSIDSLLAGPRAAHIAEHTVLGFVPAKVRRLSSFKNAIDSVVDCTSALPFVRQQPCLSPQSSLLKF